MLLERLDIDVYGPFGKKTIGSFSNGINAIWGPEGSGKTAIIDFIRGVMLGAEFGRYGTTVGRVTWADHRGMYHCQRENDGSSDGRLTTDFSPRDAVHADERFRHYGYHSRRPEAIAPALLDLVVAPDSRETSIAAIFEAAAAVGFRQAFGRAPATEEIERIRGRLVDIDAQLNRDFRGTESRDELEMRRRRLTTELDTLERDATRDSSDLRSDQRRQIEEALSQSRQHADRLRHEQENLRQTIQDVEFEMDRLVNPDQETITSSLPEDVQSQFDDLNAQLKRWRGSLAELQTINHMLPGPTQRQDGQDRYNTAALNSSVDQVYREIDALLTCYSNGYYQGGSHIDQLTQHLRLLKDELNYIRDEFSFGNTLAVTRPRSDTELAHEATVRLRRGEQELHSGINRLTYVRDELMRQISNEYNIAFDQLMDEFGDSDHSGPDPTLQSRSVESMVQSTPANSSGQRRQRMQEELQSLRAELRDSEDRLSDVVEQIDNLQRDQASFAEPKRPILNDRRMGHLRQQLTEVRRRLDWVDSRDGLRRERERLADEMRRLEARELQTESPLTACANHWLSRITAGRLRTLELVNRDEVRVDQRRETDISTDDRRAAGLALRMAICCLLNENRTGIPIVIDDPVIYEHDHRCVARTLCEFAAGGNQVVVLTRSQALVDTLSDQGAWTDALPARTNLNGTSGDMHDVNRYLDMQWRESNGLYDNPSRSATAGWNPNYDYPRRRNMRGYYEPKHRQGGSASSESAESSGHFYLTPESHVDLAPSVDSVAAARLRGIGCESVGDLLTSNPANLASRLGLAGVSESTIRRWQIEADLVCRVPGLRGFDSRILVGCGVTRPEQLRQLRPKHLLVKVEKFLASELGRETLRSGTSFELSRLTTWIASASRDALQTHGSPKEQKTRRTTRRRKVSKSDTSAALSMGTEQGIPYGPLDSQFGNDYGPGYSYREEIDYDGDGIPDETIEHQYDDAGNRVSRRKRIVGGTARKRKSGRQRTGSQRSGNTGRQKVVSMQDASGLKFFLDRSHPVIDAPSIGSRKSEMLQTLGIVTVGDLLDYDHESIAEQLDDRKITADMVLSWQQQTTLMCTVPLLRGHDAQLLVAAGISEAEELADSDAEELLSLVTPIAESKDGKRMLRGSAKPDLAEVTDWIDWAQQRDQVRAA